MKDLLAYLFGSSQVENEVEETKSAIERIMEEAEEQEPLKVERKPLQAALKALGIGGGELEYDPEGFSLVCDDEADYRHHTEVLLSPDAMEKLAKLGWVVTRCGDVAMSNEPAEFRIRFLEVTTAGEDGEDKDSWPAPNPELVKKAVKAGREFMSEPGPHDDDGPVEYDDKTSDDNQKGVGKPQQGKDPEGKPKGSSKSEGLSLAAQLIGVNEGRHKDGCQCGFCKNMGSFGKKKKEEEPETEEPEVQEESELEQRQVPYVGKDGKQRTVPWVGKKKVKTNLTPDEDAQFKSSAAKQSAARGYRAGGLATLPDAQMEPPRYDDMFEAKKKAPGVGKPKAPKTVPKSFKK